MNSNKRQFRELDDATKQKISMALKGRSKGISHKENISKGLKEYWKGIPYKPTENNRPNIN